MIKNIQALYEKYRTKLLKRKVRKDFIKRYEEDIQLELMLEKWVIKRIIDGQTSRREELKEKQSRIKETQLLLDFLKNNE